MCRVDYADDGACILLGDYDYKAKKPHLCGECGRAIEPGETYNRQTIVFDGRRSSHKFCAHCEVCRDWLQHECGGWLYGQVGEEIIEHYREGYEQVGRIAVGIQRGWKRFKGDGLMPIPVEPFNSHQSSAMGANGGGA